MCFAMIRRFVHSLPQGKIFTTRDCLAFGARNAVDQALYRLVKIERIRRLARGVFVRDDSGIREFDIREIVKVKAAAFGRVLLQVDPDEGETTFWINGRESKFRVGNKVIRFKHAAPRKYTLEATKVGKAMRKVWKIGIRLYEPRLFTDAMRGFDREDYVQLRRTIRWMPAWLSDQIKSRHWDNFHHLNLLLTG